MMLKQLPVLVILWILAAFAEDSDVTDIESNIVVSAVISLQSKDFAQALQAHPLLMVTLSSNIAKGTTDPGVDCFDQ